MSEVIEPKLDSRVNDRSFLGQPRALSTLFFTEMWERFSYYGMRALLVLYLTAPLVSNEPGQEGLGIPKGTAIAIYGTYSGLIYLTPIAGGWVADRLLGHRRTVLYGGIVIAVGHYFMATPPEICFWIGLFFIALGTGMLKPNISAMVGDLYSEEDTRRDAGFSLFYMGINLGALFAPIATGWAASQRGWHWGFALAGIGMTLAVIQYVLGRKHLHGVGEVPPNPATDQDKKQALLLLGATLVALVGLVALVNFIAKDGLILSVTTAVTILILLVPVFYFRGLFARDYSPIDKDRVKAFVWIFFAAAAFWMVFEQSGSTLTLFADDVTNLSVGGWQMPASWLQSINPFFIIVFSPVFAWIWMKLANRAPSTPIKFALALVGVGISFLILVIPMAAYNSTGAKAALFWLIACYLIQTWAELLLSPTGLSATSKLAPEGASGQMLALWFLATSVGTTVGGQVGRITEGDPVVTFAFCGGLVVLIGVLIGLNYSRIKRLMHGIH